MAWRTTDVCDSHTTDRVASTDRVDSTEERAIDEWHAAVNAGDLRRAAEAVGDPVVVLGPKGAGSISPQEFADWVARSGIRLQPRTRHLIGQRLVVVEQDATWPGSDAPTRVATVFRVANAKATAALRLPNLEAALQLASV